MSDQPRRDGLRGFGLDITKPAASSVVAVDLGGTIEVLATRTDTNIVKMWTKIYAGAVATPSTYPVDALPCDVDSSNGKCQWPAVPVGATSLDPAGAENTVVVWGENLKEEIVGDDAVLFNATTTAEIAVEVSANHCIWLAWAPPGHPDPPYAERGDKYQPSPLVVPTDENITHVQIVANDADTWAHLASGSKRTTDAAGLVNDSRDLEREGYRSDDLRSSNIVGSNLPLNMLVALLGVDPDTEATEHGVGLSKTLALDADGTRAKYLFLAFHDGHQWPNNTGKVGVTVTWQEGDGSASA